MTHFGRFGGYRKWHLGCPNQNSKTTFQCKYPPLKPPFRHFGNHFGPRKSDFWPCYLFWSFFYWNSHWSRKIVPTWEGKVVEQKQKQFWNQWTRWQNLGICKIRISEKVKIRIALPYHLQVSPCNVHQVAKEVNLKSSTNYNWANLKGRRSSLLRANWSVQSFRHCLRWVHFLPKNPVLLWHCCSCSRMIFRNVHQKMASRCENRYPHWWHYAT